MTLIRQILNNACIDLGLLLVPNGEAIGYALGDYYPEAEETNSSSIVTKSIQPHRSTASETVFDDTVNQITPHPWGIFFTILGTVLLDFDADACQSPARAYLLDVTIPGEFFK